ncbi:MAG: 2Fe-2S iron-sulfur cluster-binding protein [Candidatus Gracilibacteria bacterium]|jgi:ferredoxin
MPKVTFKNTGATVEVAAGAMLKDVTKNNKWPVAYGCEDGMCGTCMIKVAEGGGNLSPMEEKEKGTLEAMGMDVSQYRLCCQCKINGDCVIEQ